MINTKSISVLFKSEWRICLTLSVLAFVGASLFMSGWSAGLLPELTIPFSYSGDGMSYLWNVQRVAEGTWFYTNERAGFPFDSNHLDYPTSDTGNYLALKLLGLVFGNAFATLNAYFLLGFSLCAVSTYLVSRTVSISRDFSIAIALLYTFSSFHFGRLGHLFFTWYFVAPLFFYVGFRIFSKQLIFTNSSRRWTTKLANILALVALASFGIYYALFGCFVIAMCTALAAAFHRSWRCVSEGLLTLGFIVFGVLLNIAPSLIYIFISGENREGVTRLAAESELYALKITQMLLPRGDHRLDTFFEFASKYNSSFPLVTENISASLGTVGSLGFLLLIGIVLLSPAVFSRSHNAMTSSTQDTGTNSTGTSTHVLLFQLLAALSLGLVLLATVGGFSSLFAMLVSSSIRSWNRISIFIAFLSVMAIILAIDVLLLKYCKPAYVKITGVGIAILIIVLGVLDQTVKPCHACKSANSALFNNDKAFVQAIESALPKNAAIYQLPYMAYPENGSVNNLGSYDQARGLLHSKNLRWSFGSVRGREGDWFFRKLALLPIKEQVTVVSVMGYAGIYIDRRGYLDAKAQTDKRCAAFEDKQVDRLKNNCVTVAELEHDITSTEDASSALQKLVSKDQLLSFMPLKTALYSLEKSAVNAEKLSQANAYLLPIGFKLLNGIPVQTEGGFETSIDLRENDPDLPVYVGGVTGLSGISITNGIRVGRWSDALTAKRVTVWLAKPLPKKFTLQIRAQAAGLNTEKQMQIKIGKQTKDIIFGSEFETKTVSFEIDEPIYKIEFKPADPFSPARRWGSGDTNLIAILFQQIQIVPK
jgi:phosphoglycerol transferase